MPCWVALALLTALPAAERGPVLLSAFCRLALLRGLEGGIGQPDQWFLGRTTRNREGGQAQELIGI
jgi:hypothetical protein